MNIPAHWHIDRFFYIYATLLFSDTYKHTEFGDRWQNHFSIFFNSVFFVCNAPNLGLVLKMVQKLPLVHKAVAWVVSRA